MAYKKVKDGEWQQPKRKGYRVQCCDCGLVHVMNVRVHAGRAQFQAWRDDKATKRIRKRRSIVVRKEY